MVGLGTAIASPFIAAARSFADAGSELADTSARTGLAVENLSALSFAAQQTGSSLGALEKGFTKAQRAIIEAAAGSKKANEGFAALGLSAKRLVKLTPDEQFAAIAASIRGIEDPTARAAAAVQVFGKSGAELIPLIDGLDELRAQAEEQGLIFSAEDAARADELGDAIDLLLASFSRIKNIIGSAVAPALAEVAAILATVVKAVIEFVEANKPLFAIALKVGLAIAAFGAAVVALGAVIGGVGAVLGTIAAGIGAIGAVIGFLLSPIGLVVAALVGLGVAFFTLTDQGRQAFAFLKGGFDELLAIARQTIGGIGDALAAGDLKLAGEILFAGLDLVFRKGFGFLKGLFLDLQFFAVTTFREIVFNLARRFTDAFSRIKVAFVTVIGFLRDAFTNFIAFVRKNFNNLGGFIRKIFARIQALVSGKSSEEQRAAIDRETAAENAQVEAERSATIGERQQARTAALADIEKERSDAQAVLAQMQEEEAAERQRLIDLAKEDIAAGIRGAQERLDTLTAEAAAAADKAAEAEEEKARLAELAEIQEQIDAEEEERRRRLGQGVQAVKTREPKAEARGTFQAAALAGLGLGDTLENTAKEQVKEQKATNKKLDEANKKLANKEKFAV